MNKFTQWLAATAVMGLVSANALASNLSVPNTFVSGTTAKASEVNGNFTAVETAVNDNDGRITTVEGDVSSLTSGVSTLQSGKVNVSGDTMTGTLTVPSIAYSTARTHYYAISGDMFRTRKDTDAFNCGYSSGGCYVPTATSTAALIAPMHLPDGATVTNITAFIFDNNASSDLTASLYVQSFTSAYFAYGTVTSSGQSSTVQQLSITPISNLVVNNQTQALEIHVSTSAGWPGDATLAIRGVSVAYTISEAP